MQGLVFDIKRFAIHDGPGIRTTVFFKGCNMSCLWCHNPESIGLGPFTNCKKVQLNNHQHELTEEIGKYYTIDEITKIVLNDILFMEESGGGVTISGGEPTIQSGFLISLLETFTNIGLHTALDTNGYINSAILRRIIPNTNLFLFDFKHHNSNKHLEYTGLPNELILKNLTLLLQNKCKVRVRIPIIPGFNYTNTELLDIRKVLQPYTKTIDQIDLLPFHSIASNKYHKFGFNNQMENIKSLQNPDLEEAKKLFEQVGFKVTIGG